MLLNLTDLSTEPLHLQISRQLRARILAGELPPGTSLPSIRVMAHECRVSVITVQKAYDDLDREGLILARRGKGFYVAELTSEVRRATATKRFEELIEAGVRAAVAEGLEASEIRKVVEKVVDAAVIPTKESVLECHCEPITAYSDTRLD